MSAVAARCLAFVAMVACAACGDAGEGTEPPPSAGGEPPLGIWMRSFGDSADDRIDELAVDSVGNIYAAGACTGRIDFDGIVSDGEGASDAVVISLDPNGRVRWVFRDGDFDAEEATGLSLFDDGAVLMSGVARHRVDTALGDDEPPASLLVIRLDSSGNPSWRLRVDSTEWISGHAIATESGTVVVGGAWMGTIEINGAELSVEKEKKGFLFEVDGAGAWKWHLATERPVTRLARLENGAFLAGSTQENGAYLERRRTDGGVEWAAPVPGAPGRLLPGMDGGAVLCAAGWSNSWIEPQQFELGAGALLAVDGHGQAIALPELPEQGIPCAALAGNPAEPVIAGTRFGATLPSGEDVPSLVYSTVGQVSAAGSLLWTRTYNPAKPMIVHAIAVTPDGDLVLGGTYLGTVDFGSGPVTSRGGSTMMMGDLFIARLKTGRP